MIFYDFSQKSLINVALLEVLIASPFSLKIASEFYEVFEWSDTRRVFYVSNCEGDVYSIIEQRVEQYWQIKIGLVYGYENRNIHTGTV